MRRKVQHSTIWQLATKFLTWRRDRPIRVRAGPSNFFTGYREALPTPPNAAIAKAAALNTGQSSSSVSVRKDFLKKKGLYTQQTSDKRKLRPVRGTASNAPCAPGAASGITPMPGTPLTAADIAITMDEADDIGTMVCGVAAVARAGACRHDVRRDTKDIAGVTQSQIDNKESVACGGASAVQQQPAESAPKQGTPAANGIDANAALADAEQQLSASDAPSQHEPQVKKRRYGMTSHAAPCSIAASSSRLQAATSSTQFFDEDRCKAFKNAAAKWLVEQGSKVKPGRDVKATGQTYVIMNAAEQERILEKRAHYEATFRKLTDIPVVVKPYCEGLLHTTQLRDGIRTEAIRGVLNRFRQWRVQQAQMEPTPIDPALWEPTVVRHATAEPTLESPIVEPQIEDAAIAKMASGSEAEASDVS